MKYMRFEELPCWQDARKLSQMVFELIRQKELSTDYSLRDQIWRAAGSVMDNIAEGFDDGATNEFVRFLGYAQRSAGEIQSQLYRALDCGYISRGQFQSGYEAAANCRKQIKGFRRYLRSYGPKRQPGMPTRPGYRLQGNYSNNSSIPEYQNS